MVQRSTLKLTTNVCFKKCAMVVITRIGHITNVEDQLMSSPAFDAKYGHLVSWLEFYNCISATPILGVFSCLLISCPYRDHMWQILIGYLEHFPLEFFGHIWTQGPLRHMQ